MPNRFLVSDVRTTDSASETTLQNLINTLNDGIKVGGEEETPLYTIADSSYVLGTTTAPGDKGDLFLVENSTGDYVTLKLNADDRQAVECHIDEVNQTGTMKTELINIEQTKEAAVPGSYDGIPVLGNDGSVFRNITTDTAGNVQVKVINGSQRVPVSLDQVGGVFIDLGTTTASASLPVTVASDEARIRTSNGIVEYYPDLGTGFSTSGMNLGVIGGASRQELQCCSRLRVEAAADIAYIYSATLSIVPGVPVEFEGTFNQNQTGIETAIGLVDDVSEAPTDGILIVQTDTLDIEIRQIQGGTIFTTEAFDFDVDIGNLAIQEWHDFKIVIYPAGAPVLKFYYRSSTQPDWYVFHTIYARDDNNTYWFNNIKNLRVYARCTGVVVASAKWTDISVLNVYQGRDAGIPAPVTDLKTYSTDFNQLMVAEETPMLQYSFSRNINNRLFGTVTSGDPTVSYITANGGSAQCKLEASDVGQAGIWSYETVNYRNGEMAVVRFTSKIFNGSGLGPGAEILVGIGDRLDASTVPDNGIFFSCTTDGIGVRIRRGGSDSFSRPFTTCTGDIFELDTELGKYYLFEIRFSYLGAFGAQWRVYNVDTQRWHIIEKYKVLAGFPFIYNSNLSFVQLVDSAGTPTGAVTVDTHSVYLGVVGKSVPNIEPRTVATRQTGLGDGAYFLGIRNVTTYATQSNFGRIYIKDVQVAVENGGGNVSAISVYKNPDWGVGAMANLSNLDASNSIIEVSTNPGTPSADGVLIGAVNLTSSGSDQLMFKDITLAPGEELIFKLSTTLGTAVNMSVLLHEDI